MKKIIIDGGDNGYCAYSNSLCDRNAILVDTTEKTLRYVGGGICLCQHCFYPKSLNIDKEKAWYLFRDVIAHFNSRGRMSHRYKYYAECVGKDLHSPKNERMKVEVKSNKWGKDCEFGIYGSTYGATYKIDPHSTTEIELVRFRKDREQEYWNDSDSRAEKPKAYWFEKTGWKLVVPPKESLCD